MCIKIVVLYTIIGVVMVWFSVVVSTAAMINNGGSFECLMAGFNDVAV